MNTSYWLATTAYYNLISLICSSEIITGIDSPGVLTINYGHFTPRLDHSKFIAPT